MARSAVTKLPMYVVQARFTDERATETQHTRFLTRDGVVFLDEEGNWSSLSEAARHASRKDAEKALEAKWASLRARGSKNAILAVKTVLEDVADKVFSHTPPNRGSDDHHA